MTGSDAGAGQQQGQEVCELSQRVDGKLHSWRFDGDDPYVICVYCDRMQDAMTGRVFREGNNRAPSPTPPARDSGQQSEEAREAARDALGQRLSEWTASQRWWVKASDADRESYREDADELLSLPAVAALLRDVGR